MMRRPKIADDLFAIDIDGFEIEIGASRVNIVTYKKSWPHVLSPIAEHWRARETRERRTRKGRGRDTFLVYARVIERIIYDREANFIVRT